MAKKVRAKFQCVSIIKPGEGFDAPVCLRAVYSETGENKDFTDVTPVGELNMNISDGAKAIDSFKEGKEYYLDFTEADN